jgi:CubicO group peptidase (beta-lactamase class C family)
MPSRRSLLQATGSGLAAAAFAPLAPRPTRLAASPTRLAPRQATPVVPSTDEILTITRQAMDEYALRATILHVAIDGDVVLTDALGESMTGVPATADMRFRNGAVAISLVSTLMLTLVDDGVIELDQSIGDLLPDLPESDTVTFRMLANMTAGYRDHVQNPDFLRASLDDPFRAFIPEEIVEFSLAQPRLFAPGTNWEYSHSAYFILGLALEAATGQSVEQLLQERVLDPLDLSTTINDATGQIPGPVLHAFTSERRGHLGIDPETRFYEESTYWDPSWTLTQGAVQTSDILDFGAAMVAVGEGTLLSPKSHAAQLDQGLRGFGAPLDGCNTCQTLGNPFVYGLGVFFIGPWLVQNPLFSGYSGVSAYWPERRLSVAVANTYGEAAFDTTTGEYSNASVPLFQALAAALAPDPAARAG